MKPKDAKTYTAGDWLPFYALAGLDKKELTEAKSGHAKAVLVGQLLSPNVGRVFPIRVGDRAGRARLMVREGRSRAKHYFFAVVWDEVEPATEDTKDDPPASEAKGARPKTKPAGTSPATRATKPTACRTQTKPPRPKPGTQAPARPAKNSSGAGGNGEAW